MSDINYISTDQIRKDLVGFLKGLESGREVAVLNRSKVIAHLNQKPETYKKDSVKRMLEIADEIRAQAKPVYDPNKSIKELYWEDMNQKYDIR